MAQKKSNEDLKKEKIFGRVPVDIKNTYDKLDGDSMTEKLQNLFNVYEEYKLMPKDKAGIGNHIRLIQKNLENINDILRVIQNNVITYEDDLFSDFEQQLESLQKQAATIEYVKEENNRLMSEAKSLTKKNNNLTEQLNALEKELSICSEKNASLIEDNYELAKKIIEKDEEINELKKEIKKTTLEV